MTPNSIARSRSRPAPGWTRIGQKYRPRAASGDGRWRNRHRGHRDVAAGQKAFLKVIAWRPQQDSNLRTRLRSARPKNAVTSTDMACSWLRGRTADETWYRRRIAPRPRRAAAGTFRRVPAAVAPGSRDWPGCHRRIVVAAIGITGERQGIVFVPHEMRFTAGHPFLRHHLPAASLEGALGCRRLVAQAGPGRPADRCPAGGARPP